MARIDELRLMARVARMYYAQGLRQTEITGRLNIHQSTVSRLLKRAEKEGIVRISLSVPSGAHPDLEERVQTRYGRREAIVVDSMLRRIDRVVGIAGGRRKTAAIRGALEGRWVNVLITDVDTAERLLSSAGSDARRPRALSATSGRGARARA